jgi:hypothetical protein
MTAALEQALRGHVGRLAREIGERLALQRGEPPVLFCIRSGVGLSPTKKACATFCAFDLGQWGLHIPPIA